MIDKLQCQTHTRTPWGQNPHRYDYRIRYLVMGLLCASVLAVFIVFIVSLVFIGDRAIKNYQLAPPDDGPTTVVEPPPTTNATNANTTTNNSPYNKSGRVT
ncbi:uncharacterized protein TRIVIDRAFT_65218 [Trichoderma virens Gv29-8]|uniref:Uncharacterized protein n=1 Tax=Hypocrea virens (strain Gv29-8 / FGSC 10586) TaxID=413071 RepID=G9NAU6_HYPVG|nr:uncharacterized protein TRIVIDRAFT_65218 [Trichoderma virens Gv29-8]EHK15957.1 hypothetical protein TRIVIDRAFT_65218 [Trichoderma virens Gv29-8]UKZ56268.1 hypothetical protein TrVGV298_010102 [Trichoderma virens]